MKKFLLFLTLMLTVCNMSKADGQTATPPCNEIWYTSSDGNPIEPLHKDVFGAAYQTSAYNDGKGVITFAGAVTTIGANAFYECASLTSIQIPESVTSIERLAFGGCTGLTSIIIPNLVESIGYAAFGGCTGLTSIEIPESVTSIGESVFTFCYGLKSVIVKWTDAGRIPDLSGDAFIYENCNLYVPEGTTDIYSGKDWWKTFKSINVHIPFNQIWYTSSDGNPIEPSHKDVFGATYQTSAYNDGKGIITFEGDINTIGEKAFQECSNLTGIRMPESVTSIGDSAFCTCSDLTNIELPESLQSIGEGAFSNCAELKGIEIPNSVTSIGNFAFYYCNSLESIRLSDSITSIGNGTFLYCTGLTGITLPESVDFIGEAAFCSTGLTSITLPESVKSIGEMAFWRTELTSVFVEWADAYNIPDLKESQFPYENCDLYIPYGTEKSYREKSLWRTFKSMIEPNLHIVDENNTVENRYLKRGEELVLDDNIKQIVTKGTVEDISVTYTRNFANADKWQGWYVPFDVTMDDMAAAGFEVAEIYGILLDNSGNTVLAFLKMDEGTVKANTPYVVRPKNRGNITLTIATTLRPTSAGNFTINSAKDTYTIGGIYEHTVGDNWYAMNKEGRFQKMGTGVSLRPLRIWMTITPRKDNPYTQPAATKSGMTVKVISRGQLYTVNGKSYLAQ